MLKDNTNISYWHHTVNLNTFNNLNHDIETEALIIGGGMVGISTQYLLSLEGVRTVLIEGGMLCQNASGNTTAKITSQHGLFYDRLIKNFGEEKAKMYAESNEFAIKTIKKIAKNNNINCDLSTLPSYVFTEKSSSLDSIEKEVKATQRLGLNTSYLDDIDLPLNIKGAIMFHNQAQFHPTKYLNELVKLILINGGNIYENTRAKSIHQDNVHVVHTTDGKTIRAKYVIIASHYPFYDGMGLYFTRLFGERSYINAVTIKETFPNGMYITAEDPVLSLRYQPYNGEKLILVGGGNHKTGDNIPTTEKYNTLFAKASELFTIKTNPFKWSAQDYYTSDGVPFIGNLSNSTENIFVATGFGKWGMTSSTVSALVIKDLIIYGRNKWQDLYNPSRVNIKTSTTVTFIKENLHTAKELIKGKLESVTDKTTIDIGQGKVIKIKGKKYGAYRDTDNNLHIVDNTCTHLGCELRWNNAEKTWDCPCHSSRFNYDGSVIEGPAVAPLAKHNHLHIDIL